MKLPEYCIESPIGGRWTWEEVERQYVKFVPASERTAWVIEQARILNAHYAAVKDFMARHGPSVSLLSDKDNEESCHFAPTPSGDGFPVPPCYVPRDNSIIKDRCCEGGSVPCCRTCDDLLTEKYRRLQNLDDEDIPHADTDTKR